MASCLIFVNQLTFRHAVDNRYGALVRCFGGGFVPCFDSAYDLLDAGA